MGRSPSFDECLRSGQELRRTYDSDPDAKQDRRRRQGPRGDRPQQLDPRRRGRDLRPPAAGDRPAAARRGPRRGRDRERATANGGRPERAYKTVTQYSMGPIEEIGLLKMDFLGLRNLDVIEDAVEIIERSRGERIDDQGPAARRPRPPTRCSRAATRSASSSSSPTACATPCARCEPTEFQDLVALVSLYRPGAMRYIPQYAQGKRDPAIGHATRTSACARSPSPPTAA